MYHGLNFYALQSLKWFLPPTSDNIMPFLILALLPCLTGASLPLKTILDFPILIPSPSPNITTVLGSNVDLSCRIRNVGNRTVSKCKEIRVNLVSNNLSRSLGFAIKTPRQKY